MLTVIIILQLIAALFLILVVLFQSGTPFFSNFLSIDIYILWLRLDVEIYQLQPSLDIKRRTVFVNVWQIAADGITRNLPAAMEVIVR